MPQFDILLHGFAAQIDVTIFKSHLLVGQHGLAGKKRRLLRFIEDAQFFCDQFHFPGNDVLVYCVRNTLLDRADHGDHILVAQCLSLLVNGWVPLFVEDYLRDSAAISFRLTRPRSLADVGRRDGPPHRAFDASTSVLTYWPASLCLRPKSSVYVSKYSRPGLGTITSSTPS